MIPCDICERFGHPWYDCPDRGKKPVGWKPERLRKGRPAARGSSSKPVIVREVGAPDSNKSTAAPVSEPRKGRSMPGKGASRTVPQASHADTRVEVTSGGSDPSRTTGGRHQQPALRTEVALGAVDTLAKAEAEAEAAHLAPKHPGGRPKKHKDRNAYRAKKAKEYRERDRAAKAQQEGK